MNSNCIVCMMSYRFVWAFGLINVFAIMVQFLVYNSLVHHCFTYIVTIYTVQQNNEGEKFCGFRKFLQSTNVLPLKRPCTLKYDCRGTLTTKVFP